jgi:hypothetical protein
LRLSSFRVEACDYGSPSTNVYIHSAYIHLHTANNHFHYSRLYSPCHYPGGG